MSKYVRPFKRQEPQLQRQRMSRITRLLHKAKRESYTADGVRAIQVAIDAIQREKDRLLPPVPEDTP